MGVGVNGPNLATSQSFLEWLFYSKNFNIVFNIVSVGNVIEGPPVSSYFLSKLYFMLQAGSI